MKIKINGHQWDITIEDPKEMMSDGGLWLFGETTYNTQTIRLNSDQKNIQGTLIHELVHAWLYEHGHNQQERTFKSEDVCEIVACMYEFVSDTVEKFLESNEYKEYLKGKKV